jgi:hypothetical protein
MIPELHIAIIPNVNKESTDEDTAHLDSRHCIADCNRYRRRRTGRPTVAGGQAEIRREHAVRQCRREGLDLALCADADSDD